MADAAARQTLAAPAAPLARLLRGVLPAGARIDIVLYDGLLGRVFEWWQADDAWSALYASSAHDSTDSDEEAPSPGPP